MVGDARHMVNFFHVFQILPGFRLNSFLCHTKKMQYTCNIACVRTNLDIWMTHNFSALFFFIFFFILSLYPTHQKQSTTRPTINALLKHCVLIASSLKYLHSVLVKVPALCFKGSNLIASRCVTWWLICM